jgi:hypothetical protein
MAKELRNHFRDYEKNKDHMLKVLRNHRRAAYNVPNEEYEKLINLSGWYKSKTLSFRSFKSSKRRC